MKTTKILIKNLFGISEIELNGKSIEVTGTNGVGKTSVIDAIRYALTNSSQRDYIIKNGEKEGEILIETDAGIYIDRKKRTNSSDYKSIKSDGKEIASPENFLKQLFTPLQLDPVAFTQMPRKEQNRVMLDLIEFDWDLNWIKENFGELPNGVDYQQNILQVLHDIQSENGDYFKARADLNKDIRNKKSFISDIEKDIPVDYQSEIWEQYNLGSSYKKLEKIRTDNGKIERAKIFKDSYDNKIRGYQADKEISISSEEKIIANEKNDLTSLIEKLKAEQKSAEDKLKTLADKLSDKVALVDSKYNEKVAKLDGDMTVADEFIGKEVVDVSDLEVEIENAEKMKNHLNEFNRMNTMKGELKTISLQSENLTSKIELARNLPSDILQTATIPIQGFTVENGIPLINGLPISNLSEGEQLNLCVDVALSKPNSLQIILIDGAEKLSDKNRDKLYSKCKEKGLQFIATRTTNADGMEIHYL